MGLWALMIVLFFICFAVGFALAENELTWWALMMFSLVALIGLQSGYVVTSLIEHSQ